MKIIIPGTPVAKGRPRVSRWGTYTPEKTVNYENLVKLSYMQQVNKDPLDGALEAEMTFYFPIPKSYTKKKKELIKSGKLKFLKKPDIDNCIKAILDALNGVAFCDDNQVFKVTARKEYSDNPRAEVFIQQLDKY